MRLPATLALVLRRACSHPAPVVAVALDVLVVCTLVAALAASLGLLQRDALRSALAAAPVEETVLTATTPYDEEDPTGQDAAVREALAPVVEVAGGDVVSVAESGTYDVTGPAGRAGATTLAAVSGADDRLRVEGELPADDGAGGPVPVAVPADSDLVPGDRLTLRQRADEREVAAEVVGRWELPDGQQRWLADLDPTSMLVAPERLPDLAGSGAAGRWRAVPDVTALGTARLATMADAAAGALVLLEAVAEDRGGSVQAETSLVQAMGDRTRELTTLRALLLVPAALLVLVAGAGLLLVAAGLADVRRDEESLLRSRGAGQRQLVGPTLLETLVVCGLAAALAPLVAALLVRIDGVRPPLALSGWVASGAAAAACAVALTVPVAVRAATGDRGRQETAERLRRRRLTLLATVLMLVVALGALAVAELRGFGDSLGPGTTTAATDPLLVAAPALLLLALAVVAGLLLVPPALRLVARLTAGRDAPVVLGTRFAARATGRTAPLALAVTLATGTLAFASLEASSSAASRTDRAAYVTGGDVRVGAPPEAQRAGAAAERARLGALDGVTDVVAVHRGGTFLDDLPADVVLADLAGHPELLLGDDPDRDVVDAAVDPGLDDLGAEVPPGTAELSVGVREAGTDALQVVLAGPDGGLTAVAGASGQNPLVVDVTGLPDGTRLVAAVTGVEGEPDTAAGLEVLADGEPVETPASWWVLDDTAVVVAADAPPSAPGSLPAVVTEDLAESASLEVGDTIGLTALGVPTGIEVAATVPDVRTVADGSGGILIDTGTALPLLLAGGLDGAPDEWWLEVADGAGGRVAQALATEPDIAASVTSRGAELDRLDVDPGTGGAALGRVLLVTGVGCLLVGALLLVSIVLLRRRERGEQARMLGVAGGDRRLLSGVVAWEYGVVAAVGLVVGLLAGAVVAAVTLAATTLGPGGGPLQPAPRLAPDALTLLLPPLVMLAVPLLAMLWTVRRDHPRGLGLVDGQGVRR